MSEFGNGGESSPHLLRELLSKIDSERPNPGQLGGGRHSTHGSPRVLLLDRLIGNFLERVLVCVFFVLLLLLFYRCLLIAFFAELALTATPLALSHLGVRGRRQYRDHRSDHKGSHLDGSLAERSAWEANIRIVANPPSIFKIDHPDPNHACPPWARIPENNVEGVYAAFRQPKIRGFVARMHA
jgi:hypothetical protein